MKLPITLLAGSLAGASGAALAADYGTVVSTQPVVVQVSLPQRVCSEGQVLVQPPTTGGGQVLGAIVGGVVGNSIGGGSGRAAATGLGLIAGSIIGHNAEAAGTPPEAVNTRHCTTTTRLENRVIGYDVTYEYQGRRQTVRMAQAPGERVELNLTVTGALPAAEAVAEAAAPPPTVIYESAPSTAAPVYVYPGNYGYYGYPGYYGYYGYGGPIISVVPSLHFGAHWGRRGHGRWR